MVEHEAGRALSLVFALAARIVNMQHTSAAGRTMNTILVTGATSFWDTTLRRD
jgi:hypothetical protein